MNSNSSKTFWRFGSLLRNPHYAFHYWELKKSEGFSAESLEELQVTRLKHILFHAFQNSPYYKKTFRDNNFDPLSDFSSLDDLKKVPVVIKDELIKKNDQIHITDFDYRVFNSETSGSTGQSLKFKKDENWDSFNRAARARGFSWYGVKPWDQNGYLWGYNFSRPARVKTSILDSLQNRFRIFSYNDDAIIRFAHKLKNAEYICGYSSMIYEVAKRINEIPGIPKPLNLKMVCGTSEKIYESYQDEAIKAFGRKIIGEYGAAEAGIIAFECPHGSLHLNMEGVLVEEDKGEIIVTNLVALSFPIIRYKLGDYIKLRDPSYECPCGMKHRVIEDVIGRVGKVIYGKKGKYPSLTFYYIFKNLATNHNIELNYQAVQERKGELVIKIQQELTNDGIMLLNKELVRYFAEDISCTIETDKKLHSMNGKFKDFISTIE